MMSIDHIPAIENSIRIAIEVMQSERLRLLPLVNHYHRRGDLPGLLGAQERDAVFRSQQLTQAIHDLQALLTTKV